MKTEKQIKEEVKILENLIQSDMRRIDILYMNSKLRETIRTGIKINIIRLEVLKVVLNDSAAFR